MLSHTYKKNGVGVALNEATLPLILYHKVKNIEHVIVGWENNKNELPPVINL